MANASQHPPVDLTNAGGGTLLVLTYLSLIPGFLPALALTALVFAVVVVPALALGLAAAIGLGPPYVVWRLAARARRVAPGAPGQARRRRHAATGKAGVTARQSRPPSALDHRTPGGP